MANGPRTRGGGQASNRDRPNDEETASADEQSSTSGDILEAPDAGEAAPDSQSDADTQTTGGAAAPRDLRARQGQGGQTAQPSSGSSNDQQQSQQRKSTGQRSPGGAENLRAQQGRAGSQTATPESGPPDTGQQQRGEQAAVAEPGGRGPRLRDGEPGSGQRAPSRSQPTGAPGTSTPGGGPRIPERQRPGTPGGTTTPGGGASTTGTISGADSDQPPGEDQPETTSGPESTSQSNQPPGIGETSGRFAEQRARLEEEYGINFGPDAVTEDGQLTLRARQRIGEVQFEEQLGVDIDPSDVQVSSRGELSLSRDALQDVGVQKFQSQTDTTLTPGDIRVEDGQIGLRQSAIADELSEDTGVDLFKPDVTPEGGLTETGAEKVLEERTGLELSPSDITQFDSGVWGLSQSFEPPEGEGGQTGGGSSSLVAPAPGESPGTTPVSVSVDAEPAGGQNLRLPAPSPGGDSPGTVAFQRPSLDREAIDEQVDEQAGTDLEPGEDYTIERTDDGVSVTLTDQGQRRAQVSNTGELDAAISGFEETTGFDLPGSGPAAQPVDRDVTQRENGEQFGDFDWSFGFQQGGFAAQFVPESERDEVLGPGAETDEVEAFFESIPAQARMFAESRIGPPGSSVQGITGQTDAELREANRQAEFTAQEQAAQRFSREASIGLVTGAPTLAAGIPKTLIEGVETGAFVAGANAPEDTTVGERVGAVAQAGVNQAAITGEEAASNPAEFAGRVTGSGLVSIPATAGAIGTTTRLAGPRAGRAVSVSVQPGEELAISAARTGLVPKTVATGVPGVRSRHIGETADRQSITGRAREKASAVRRELDEVDLRASEFARDDRGMADLSGRQRSRSDSSSDADTESTATITAEDLSVLRATSDPTRGGRFGDRGPSTVIRPTIDRPTKDTGPEVTTRGESIDLGYRTPEVELERGGVRRQPLASEDGMGGVFFRGVEAERAEPATGDLVEQAERREVLVEDDVPVGDTEQQFRTEATTREGVDSALATRTEARTEADTRPLADVGTEIESLTDVFSEARGESRLEARTEARTELAAETRLETRTEARTELAVETRLETRTEARTKPAVETGFETFAEPGTDADPFEKRFVSNVASEETVLSGGVMDDGGSAEK